MKLLQAKINDAEDKKRLLNQSNFIKNQVGSGQRGDKIRTIRLQDDTVTNHITNKKMKASKYLRGFIEDLN